MSSADHSRYPMHNDKGKYDRNDMKKRRHYRSETPSDSTLDNIRSLCNNGYNNNTINAIHRACNDFNMSVETNTSPTTIDAIREICEDFHMSVNSRNSVSEASTIDAIREVCDSKPHKAERNNSTYSSDNNPTYSTYSTRSNPYEYDESRYHCDRPQYAGEKFQSIITPVTNLTPQYSGITGTVEFRMRRKNKCVNLQWEPFTGIMAASGVAFLTVNQSISNTPPYPMNWSIMIRYKDVNRQTSISVDPHTTNGNIRFYLNSDGTGTDINVGDSFYVYASSVDWQVN